MAAWHKKIQRQLQPACNLSLRPGLLTLLQTVPNCMCGVMYGTKWGSCTCPRGWFSGRIVPCHGTDPGSIPGSRMHGIHFVLPPSFALCQQVVCCVDVPTCPVVTFQAGTAGGEPGAQKQSRVYSLQHAHLAPWVPSKYVYSPSVGVVQVDEMQHLTVRPGESGVRSNRSCQLFQVTKHRLCRCCRG